MGYSVQVLATADSLEATAQACFEQTSTIGLRYRFENRKLLHRTEMAGLSNVTVKVVERPGGKTSAKAAMDDIDQKSHGYDDRQRLRRRVEASALGEEADEQR
jgi:uncharacterized protein (DUF111 family)